MSATSATPTRRSRSCTRSRRGTRPPSATCCRRCTGAWPPRARSRARCRRRPRGSEDRQVAVELPLGDVHPVVVVLLALDLDVAVEHVLAERAQDELGLGRQLDRLAEALGQLLDAEPP